MANAADKGKEKVSSDKEEQRGNAGKSERAEARGSKTAWVRPLDDCPHLQASDFVSQDQLPRVTSACETCDDLSENWGCLSCGHVYCGRYVGGHMLQHNSETSHPIAVGFRDLSFWCFPCGQYLNGLTNPKLRPILDRLHQQKFGEHLPEGRHELCLEM